MTDLKNLSLSAAKEYDSFKEYLLANGYSNFEKTLTDFMRITPPVESMFQAGAGSELANMLPPGVENASYLVLLTDFYYEREQQSGYYFEFDSNESALSMQSTLVKSMGSAVIVNEISDNKLLIGCYMKSPSGGNDQPTSRKTIALRNIINKSGLHIVGIAAYNEAGEGPRALHEVQVASYSFTKDNEEVHFTREGEAVTEMLSCGCMFNVYTNNESKMLPESIQVNNVVGSHYIRYDDLRHGYIEVYEPKGEVQFIFGELPDYVVPGKIKKFALMTADGDNIATLETEATYWRELPNYDDRFSMEIRDSDLLTYVAFTDGDIQYRLHVDYNSEIEDGVEIEVSIEGEASLTKTITFQFPDDKIATYTATGNTWAEILHDKNAINPDDLSFNIEDGKYIATIDVVGEEEIVYHLVDSNNNRVEYTDTVASGTYYFKENFNFIIYDDRRNIVGEFTTYSSSWYDMAAFDSNFIVNDYEVKYVMPDGTVCNVVYTKTNGNTTVVTGKDSIGMRSDYEVQYDPDGGRSFSVRKTDGTYLSEDYENTTTYGQNNWAAMVSQSPDRFVIIEGMVHYYINSEAYPLYKNNKFVSEEYPISTGTYYAIMPSVNKNITFSYNYNEIGSVQLTSTYWLDATEERKDMFSIDIDGETIIVTINEERYYIEANVGYIKHNDAIYYGQKNLVKIN